MPLIRTEKQKDSLAKFLYDVAKIVLATAVILPVVNLSVVSYWTILAGLAVAASCLYAAYLLDGKETQP